MKKHYPRVKLMAVCGASNVTGHINAVHQIAELAHGFGAPILVDGAQLIPHHSFDMKPHNHPQHIDFLAFSGHKIFAPYGCGVLIGPREVFARGAPEYSGGGTVNLVLAKSVYWGAPPDRDEAGSPNVPGAYALAAALSCLKRLGMLQLSREEQRLSSHMMEGLRRNREVILYGSYPRVGVVSFNIKGMPHALVGAILCFEAGIGVRTGCFCAQGYVRRLLGEKENLAHLEHYANKQAYLLPGMVRVSLAAYNTSKEVDLFLHTVERISRNKKAYREYYHWSEQLGTYIPKRNLPADKLVDRHLPPGVAPFLKNTSPGRIVLEAPPPARGGATRGGDTGTVPLSHPPSVGRDIGTVPVSPPWGLPPCRAGRTNTRSCREEAVRVRGRLSPCRPGCGSTMTGEGESPGNCRHRAHILALQHLPAPGLCYNGSINGKNGGCLMAEQKPGRW
ncbi:MAG: aminotransferase class V-fold PLP-dependent enzyme [Syntrophomonadaceae bacterium]